MRVTEFVERGSRWSARLFLYQEQCEKLV
jgi:hypothetical protein